MNRFWRKQLPALLLAMIMVIGMMPAAMAEEPVKHTHNWSTEWSRNSSQHWHGCDGCEEKQDEKDHSFAEVSRREPTCYQGGEVVEACTVCGYQKTTTLSATGDHDYGSEWQKDGEYHWHGCTTKGCTAVQDKEKHSPSDNGQVTEPTCTAAGYITYTCDVCGGSYKQQTSAALGHSYENDKCTRCGASKPNSGLTGKNISVYVETSDAETVGSSIRTKINSYFSGNFSTVTFGSPSGTTYGTLYANSDKKSLSTREYTYSNSGSYPVSSLYFVSTSKEGTYSVPYTAADSSGNTVSGKLYIYVEDSTVSGSTISYTVKAGEEVAFKKSDFQAAYREEYSTGTIKYVTFETDDTLSTTKGTVYYNYDGSGEKAFTNSNIDDYDFYYSSSGDGDYALASLSYVAPKGASSRTVELTYTAYYSSTKYVEGTVKIKVTSGSSGTSGDTITYEVEPGESVAFKKTDFKEVYDAELDGTIRYVEFSTSDTLSTSSGTVYYNYDESGEKAFTKSNIDDYQFYYTSSSYGDYALANLSFAAPKSAGKRTVELDFKIYDSDDDYVSGTVEIKVGEGDSSSKGDITYEVDAGKEKAFSRKDFNNYYQDEKNSSNTIKWVTFSTSSTLNTTNGTVYFDYDGDEEKSFTKSTIDDYKFYYSSASYGDYALEDLSFVAGKSFSNAVELKFKAYYSSSSYAEGTLVIQPKEDTTTAASFYLGDIVYYSTYNASVQIKASDISRFFQSKYPTSTLQSVVLGGVPATGSLYYNYFGVSKYGASKLKLTAANCKQYTLYANPTSASQYALTELLYVPSGSNYCTAIPFTAYGSGSKSASGTILISVTLNTVGEVYGVTPKNTAVNFPASAIFSAVASATGSNLSSIQLLKLPASSVGTVYVGSGTATKANTLTQYGYSSGSHQMGQLRFVPATGYTGSVEIPYVAYNSSGTAIAAGKFCLGVVNNLKKFTDVTSSTWCYKYVVELADSKVIDGYSDGTFKPNNTITYGAALKLVMLAAGYPEQKPTDSNVFSGYLAKARAEGIITRSNVDLTKPITRLQVAQLAAGALKLDTTNLSSVKPFTDTTDASVQALNAAGIVEGYFSGGTSTYKPNNTLTRGQVSAIVWRMRNYKK